MVGIQVVKPILTLWYHKEAQRRTPDNETAYHNRGWSYCELGQYEKAIVDNTEALQFNSEFGVVYLNRGLAEYDLRQYDSGTLGWMQSS